MSRVRSDIEPVRAVGRWLLFDPLRHRYFAAGSQQLTRLLDGVPDDATDRFLEANELVAVANPDRSRLLHERAAGRREGWVMALLHRYLFLRIPLVRPDRFLDATLPFVRPFIHPATAVALVLLGAFALLLVARRWDEFAGSFELLLTWQGAALYGVAIAVLKTLHEFGHAYALKRHGGSVPSMGVAFVVLFPILYTDTSDAWLLDRRRRLAVDLAGIAVELAVAVIATWVWIVLPDGSARSVAFSLAAVSWTISLAVNLNPFMRFDGYHVLADALDMPNLQDRSFALARWRLREFLFAPGERPLERFASARRRWLVLYAWTTWTYRLVLFTGIALLVYHMAFKLLGILLFCVEMGWFVIRPVWREARTWRCLISPQRVRSLAGFVPILALLAALALPLDQSVRLPAVLEVGRVHVLRAPANGEILLASEDGVVRRGERVAIVRRPGWQHGLKQLSARRERLLARSVHAPDELRRLSQTKGEMALLAAARRSAIRAALQTTIVATADGTLRLHRDVRTGRAVGTGDRIGFVVSRGNRVVALADESVAERLSPGSKGVFRAEIDDRAVAVSLRNGAQFPTPTVEPPELALRHGGPIATRRDGVPLKPHFPVRFTVAAEIDLPSGRWRGTVTLPATPRSYGWAMLERLHSVWIRESGF